MIRSELASSKNLSNTLLLPVPGAKAHWTALPRPAD